MKRKKILSIIMSIVISSFILAGCSKSTAASNNSNNSTTSGQTSTVSVTSLSASEIIKTEDMFTSRDKEIGYSESESIAITLNGSSASCADSNVKISGQTVTISKEGTYILTGTLENGSIVIDAADTDKINIILKNAEINNNSGAAIYVKKADKVFITSDKGTTNTLKNSGEFKADGDTNIDGVIFAKSDLTLNGEGKLTVSTKNGHGIVSKDDLVFYGGNYDISSTGNSISGKDSVRIAVGTFKLQSEKDGIHSENSDDNNLGFIYISGGAFDIDVSNDGIQATSALQIDGGTFDIVTGRGSANAAPKTENNDFGGKGGFGGGGNRPQRNENDTNNMTPPDMNNQDGNMQQPPEMPQGDNNTNSNSSTNNSSTEKSQSSENSSTSTDESTTESMKGIKASGDILIKDGEFKLDTADDSFHSNKNMTVSGGTVSASSGDDGMHAEKTLTIEKGNITVAKSYEGLEGDTIAVNGGNVSVTSNDDGVNSSSKIEINGGILKINATGDCVDSNGDLSMTGGEVYINGINNSGNGILDYDNSAVITGGTIIGVDTGNMEQNFGSSSTQGSILITRNTNGTGTVTVKDESNNIIATFEPDSSYNAVLISSPKIEKGKTYTVTMGTETQTIKMDSLIYGAGSENGMGHSGGRGNRGNMQNGTTNNNTSTQNSTSQNSTTENNM